MKLKEWVFFRTSLTVLLLLFLSFSSIAFTVRQAYAQQSSIDVELVVPETKVAFSGYAAPNSLVKIVKNSATISSTVADSSGFYSSTFSHPSGVHGFDVYYSDILGLESTRISTSVSIATQKTTHKTIHLSPTIKLGSQSSVSQGSIVKIFGYTRANSEVTVLLDYGSKSYKTNSDNTGYYEYFLQTGELLRGEHLVSTRVSLGGSDSPTSSLVRFIIEDSTDELTPDLIVGPAVIAPPSILLPDDGAVIDSETVEIIGEAIPGSQINIYQDGVFYGSVVTDSQGRWKFVFSPTYSPVTLSFESCIDGECSILSRTITLAFTALQSTCDANPELVNYRFWGVGTEEIVTLELKKSFTGTITIDWGDGVTERFSSSATSIQNFSKTYRNPDIYQGIVKFEANDCTYERYFSVHVVQSENESQLYIFFILLLGLVIGSYLYQRDKTI